MQNNYTATEKDFKAIEEGIQTVWSPKLSFIFKDKDIIRNSAIVAFDSKYIYIWTTKKLDNVDKIYCSLKNYFAYKCPHNIDIENIDRMGWRAGIWPLELNNFLPRELKKNDFEIPKPCGSMLGDFIVNQKKIRGEKNNPYITHDSYLATIVHEFGHIYYNQHRLWWYSDKTENIGYLQTALNLYLGKKTGKIKVRMPSPTFFNEIFAFCSEYSAAKIFWQQHKENLDKFAVELIKNIIKEEEQKNLDNEDSVLQIENAHYGSFVLGKILIEESPASWPQKLLQQQIL